MVLGARDVGEDGVQVASLTRPMAMPATGVETGTPASIIARVAPHTVAIELEPLDFENVADVAHRVGEALIVGDNRRQRPLRQRAVADLATSRAAHEPNFTHAERGEL